MPFLLWKLAELKHPWVRPTSSVGRELDRKPKGPEFQSQVELILMYKRRNGKKQSKLTQKKQKRTFYLLTKAKKQESKAKQKAETKNKTWKVSIRFLFLVVKGILSSRKISFCFSKDLIFGFSQIRVAFDIQKHF